MPSPGEVIQDYGNIISGTNEEEIRRLQLNTYVDQDTPIVVVTVQSMARFNAKRNQIEKVARDLFDHWQIGKRDQNNRLINKGILLLVSVGDRKARIELGADWNRDWDNHCDEIMQNALVPRFKNGEYSEGILEGVKRLAKMAQQGPDGKVPFSIGAAIAAPMIPGFNSIPRWAGWLMMLLGVVLIGLGFLMPDVQKPLVFTGIGLILFAILFKAIIIVILAYLSALGGGSDDYDSGWSGGGGGGGFGSGGFSGGGGSTGSW